YHPLSQTHAAGLTRAPRVGPRHTKSPSLPWQERGACLSCSTSAARLQRHPSCTDRHRRAWRHRTHPSNAYTSSSTSHPPSRKWGRARRPCPVGSYLPLHQLPSANLVGQYHPLPLVLGFIGPCVGHRGASSVGLT